MTSNPIPTETALFAFIVPTLNIPIQIPISVRTGSDYGLNFKVSEITQVTPLAGADLTFWGFPPDNVHEAQRFPKGSTGRPAGCAGLPDTSCLAKPTPISAPVHPLTDNPDDCNGTAAADDPQVQTYQDPEHFSKRRAATRRSPAVKRSSSSRCCMRRPTTQRNRLALGPRHHAQSPAVPGYAASPSEIEGPSSSFRRA